MKIRNCMLAAALMGSLAAPPALAAEPGGYFGFGAGFSKVELEEDDINDSLAALGFGANTTADDSDTGFKIYGGYRFTSNLAVEVGYTDFGEATFESTITSGGAGTVSGSFGAYSFNVSALGIAPINEKFEVFGRAGLSLWNLDADFAGSGPGGTALASESENGVSPLLGLGAAFNFNERLAIRAEIERHFAIGDEDTTGESDVDLYSVGVVFRF